MVDEKLKHKLGKAAFIVWMNYCRRADTLCSVMDIKCVFIGNLIENRNIIWRLFFWVDYLYKAIRTSIFLLHYRPDIVLSQSPPSFCPIICWAYCTVFSKKFVIDAHNGAFERPWIDVPFYLNVLRAATVVLIHNYDFKKYIEKKYVNINFFVLPDKIPGMPTKDTYDSPAKIFFLIVVVYQPDEPVIEILEAAKEIVSSSQLNVVFKITGNYKRKMDIYRQYKDIKGIEFLGFISDTKYQQYLQDAYGIIALSTRSMIQQCAAVEALGAGVPMIISDSVTARKMFFKGAVMTKNDSKSIMRAIKEYCFKKSVLLEELKEIKNFWEINWENAYSEFLKLLIKTP